MHTHTRYINLLHMKCPPKTLHLSGTGPYWAPHVHRICLKHVGLRLRYLQLHVENKDVVAAVVAAGNTVVAVKDGAVETAVAMVVAAGKTAVAAVVAFARSAVAPVYTVVAGETHLVAAVDRRCA